MINMTRMFKATSVVAAITLIAGSISLSAASFTDSSSHEESNFNNGSLEPFKETTTNGSNYVKIVSKRAKVVWHEKDYNGTRAYRGAEFDAQRAKSTSDTMTGFKLYIPNGSSNNYQGAIVQFPENKNTIIWQNFQEGDCWSWAALLTIKGNDLWISHRSSCGNATEQKIYTGLPRNSWMNIQVHTRASKNNTGWVIVSVNGTRKYELMNTNFGFGNWTGDNLQSNSKQRIKFGMYCYDTSGYANQEVRTLYFDNCSVYTGNNNAWGKTNPN